MHRLIPCTLLIAALSWAAPPHARAGLILSLQSGDATVSIADNGPLDDNPATGIIGYGGPSTLGAFSILSTTSAFSQPILGGPQEAVFHLLLDVFSEGAGQLIARLTDTGFSLADAASPWNLISSIGGTTDGTVIFQESFDAANAEFGAGVTNGPVTLTGDPAFSAVLATNITPQSGPFSLTETFSILHGPSGGYTAFGASSSVIVQTVPEPASLLIWTAGALAAGWAGRRKRRERRTAENTTFRGAANRAS